MFEDSCFFVENSSVGDKGLGSICRHKDSRNGLLKNYWDGVYTIYDLFKNGVKNNPNSPCIGKRNMVNGVLSDHFEFITYAETDKQSEQLANGIMLNNLVHEIPHSEHKTPSGNNYKLVGIFSRNRMEWLITEYALFAINSSIVPFYDTLGHEAIKLILIETGIETIFCGSVEIKLILSITSENNKQIALKNIILYDPLPEDCTNLVKNVKIYYFNDLLQLGSQSSFTPTKPDELDAAFIFYTSGTTGTPKGVIMLHQNLSSLSQCGMLHHKSIFFPPGHLYLSYLPFAHVFEHFIHGIILSSGGAIGFYSGDKNLVLEDIKVMRPTIFASVPRIYNRMKDKVIDNANRAGGIKKWLFDKGLKSKLSNLKNNSVTHWFYDSIIFNKIKKMMGLERLVMAVSGSAPLSQDTYSFLKCLFGCTLMQGYGMTESAGGVCCTWPGDFTTSFDCGIIIKGCEMRLISVPEMGYSITDLYHGRVVEDGKVVEEGIACYGRGELVYRGYNTTPGYFRRPDMTSEVIDSDGWLHSGDVALITTEYKLVIIDRIKNIVKLSQGEYVAVENLENHYQTSPYVDQIFVYGDSYQACLVAIIVPDSSIANQWATQKGIDKFNFVDVCTSNDFKQKIMSELDTIAGQKKLNGIEKIRNIYLDSVPFSVEDGTLTPTMKLRRIDLKKKYNNIIIDLYKNVQVPGR